ncbi:MAG: hypothetical protein CFE24_00515 [Flavobacterium sp. BFFFF2]|nr:MAG: hypothetical protein CFE24_00515 [Flavobacterium sp. BFFFF2]
MKKIILTVAAVFAIGMVNAQDKKSKGAFGFSESDFYLSGQVGYNSNDVTTGGVSVKTTTTTFSPSAGYFLSDNFAVTAGLVYASTDNGTVKSSETNFQVGGRYYFLNLGERFKTFANADLGFGSKDSGVSGADKTSSFGLNAGIGINYFLTSNLAIDFSLANVLGYNSTKTGDDKSTKIDLFVNKYTNFFTQPTFGLLYKF